MIANIFSSVVGKYGHFPTMEGMLLSDGKSKSCLYSIFIAATIIFGAYFLGSSLIEKDYKERLSRWESVDSTQKTQCRNTESKMCKSRCLPPGSEALPEGIVAKASNMEMRSLWGSSINNDSLKPSMNLLAMAVGIKQKGVVKQIIEKFLSSNFVLMLFHYDGAVDDWRDLAWSDSAVHVSAMNQTKWWFAKRFLHPDIVAEYEYIFLWDEDLGIEHFDPGRYLAIVKEEGFEISQPAVDPAKSRVHHQITARLRRLKVHRRIYKLKGKERCDENSTAPPCVGWVEMMAPVFSRKAWQCVWYMIQNDLIHAWGLDIQLGYCAQGDRTKNIGVVDSEYIVHLGLPTLGVLDGNKLNNETRGHTSPTGNLSDSEPPAPSEFYRIDNRSAVRWQSYTEMQIFKKRWSKAAKEDKCWVDPYAQSH